MTKYYFVISEKNKLKYMHKNGFAQLFDKEVLSNLSIAFSMSYQNKDDAEEVKNSIENAYIETLVVDTRWE